MTRRRVLLALVVTVLAVGCAAPWWADVWLAVAYEEVEVEGVLLLVKRSAYLPGEDEVQPEQVCPACRCNECQKNQDFCWHNRKGHQVLYGECVRIESWRHSDGFRIFVHCTCPTCYPERQ